MGGGRSGCPKMRIGHVQTKAPQTPFRVMGRSFEQPSPENCSQPPYFLICVVRIAPTCHVAALLGQHDGCSVFIGCPPDVGLVPQNHPLCRSDAERGTFIVGGTRNQCMRGSTERGCREKGADDGRSIISHSSARFCGTVRTR